MSTSPTRTRHALALRQRLGVARSLLIYRAIPLRQRRLRRLYQQFIQAGDLCFDVGAHVGNRTHAWLALGARVVAIEPQPSCARLLRRWYGAHPQVTLVEQAVAAKPGRQTLLVSTRTPTVTTLARNWSEHLQTAVTSFSNVVWDERVEVAVTTLDGLIERYGEPAFCKLDIEGFEGEALRGLSRPLHALSFEYLPGVPSAGLDCIAQLERLGRYRFNWSPGESLRLCCEHWLNSAQLSQRLTAMNPQEGSGDVYARLA